MSSLNWRNQAVVALALLLALFTIFPFSQIGFNDEWSFARIAYDLATTGHFVYHGWAATPIGVQAIWGALWIKAFGFSYDLLHLCVMPFAIGCGYLTYSLAVQFGAKPFWAMLAALTFVLSPLFLPLAGTFMTDVPGAFFVLLSQWAALRALTTEEKTRVYGWLLLAAASCLAGTTIRQSVLLIGAPTVLYAAWRKIDPRLFLGGGLALAFLAGLIVWWFKSQPFAVRDDFGLSLLKAVRHPGPRFGILLELLAQLTLYALPCGVCVLAVKWWRRWGVWVAPALFLGVLLMLSQGKLMLLAPWAQDRGGEIITPWGLLTPDGVTMGYHPIFLTPLLRLGLTILTLAVASSVVFSEVNRPRVWIEASAATHLRWFLLPCCLYLAFLCLRYGLGGPFDRYLLPILPMFLVFLITRPEMDGASHGLVAAPGWLAMGVFAVFGITITHDYFAVSRARSLAISRLIEAGVPRSEITAGLDYDGWTQIEIAGHLGDRPVSSGSHSHEHAPKARPDLPLPYAPKIVPDINPRYFVVLWPHRGLQNSDKFPPIASREWLPPFHQAVLIEVPAKPLQEELEQKR